ncbi:hypothetical protein [Bythopirellula goksoeyrii]|uniref:Uncharacterized protein n=1 Tax=Bythopirellula goksoeyrii TaxID=1400387 RepID=A0A5B9Q8F6_9BACT|nr:hypothetical protein [Bythopirellula goksoeyrii]QEG35267.1 hypothetical protein Pr1d_25620 [Bythopirellula goksoeyrii]
MTDNHSITGNPPDSGSTGGSRSIKLEHTSKKKLIELWYIEPLERMNGHEAFVCLSVCLFLYEKYLRMTSQIGQEESFSEGHEVFKLIGKDLEIPADDAYEFWTCWRNGLAHRGMPNKSEKYKWGLTGQQQKRVVIGEGHFTINPWFIRDMILNKVKNKKQIWEDELSPFMKVFHLVEP